MFLEMLSAHFDPINSYEKLNVDEAKKGYEIKTWI